LRLAEFSFLRKICGTIPILLVDDALGELDAERKANFHKLLPDDAQVFATGTVHPAESGDPEAWEVFIVNAGTFELS